jgi:hypothetical protein
MGLEIAFTTDVAVVESERWAESLEEWSTLT